MNTQQNGTFSRNDTFPVNPTLTGGNIFPPLSQPAPWEGENLMSQTINPQTMPNWRRPEPIEGQEDMAAQARQLRREVTVQPPHPPHSRQRTGTTPPPSWGRLGGGEQLRREGAQARLNGNATPRPRLDKPLLVVACGGSGHEIAVEIKAIFLENLGELPENLRILAFDSADEQASRWDSRHGRMVTLELQSEFFYLEPVPLARIKRMRHRHPEIAERLGELLDKVHRVSIDDGAAQERLQGLLSWMWNARWVYPLIRQRVRQLVERNKDVRHEIENQSGMNVVLVGSLCGGQGAGSLLDATYFVHEALAELGELADRSRVVGMFVLPGAFAGVDGPNLLPNSYAFGQDLNALMQGKGFRSRYPGGLEIDSLEAPFHYIYLLDGVDEQSRTWPNREEVCGLGGRALSLLFGSEMGMQAIAGAVNKQGVLHRVSPEGFGSYLGTVGQAVIRFPAGQVARRCALRQALAMISDHFLAPVGAVVSEERLAGFGVAVVRDRLKLNREGAPYQVQLLAPLGLEQAAAEEAPVQVRTFFANYQQRRVYDDFFSQMAESAAGVKAESESLLAGRLDKMLSDGDLTQAAAWLDAAQKRMQGQHTALLADLEHLAEQASHAQAVHDQCDVGLDQAAESLFLVRGSRMRKALTAYLEAANDLLGLRVQQRQTELTGEVLHYGERWCSAQLRRVEGVVVRLRQVQERLASQEAELARYTVNRNEVNLADEALVAGLYDSYAGDVHNDARQAVSQSQGFLAWVQYTPEQLAETLTGLVDQAFAPLRGISVEEVLKRRWDDRSAQQWISRLQGLAAGAWNLDRSLLPGGAGLAEFTTLGVPDAADSIFASSGVSLASTYDPERIIALRTVYGASLDALKPAMQWKRSYEQVAASMPLHVLPGFQREADRSLQHFALGVIFGLIENAATWFYYKPADELAGRRRLGQGLEGAVGAFQARLEMQTELMQRISDQIAQEGAIVALERIDRYVSAGGKDDDELTRSLRRAAREYADELRRNRRATGGEA